MVLLSAGLSKLELLPGQPFSLSREPRDGLAGSGVSLGAEALALLFRVLIIIAGLLAPIAIIYLIISPEARRRVLKDLLMMLPLFAVLYLLTRAGPELSSLRDEIRAPETLPETFPSVSIAEFSADPPQWLVFATSLGLAMLLAVLFVVAAWFVWRHTSRPASLIEQLAQEAEEALGALQAGADLKDTVMRCYFEMSQVLSKQRGIKRQTAMTPREFESHVERIGLPGEHVRQLTRLFEKVRYGAKLASKDEERQAIACLRAIVEACRSSA